MKKILLLLIVQIFAVSINAMESAQKKIDYQAFFDDMNKEADRLFGLTTGAIGGGGATEENLKKQIEEWYKKYIELFIKDIDTKYAVLRDLKREFSNSSKLVPDTASLVVMDKRKDFSAIGNILSGIYRYVNINLVELIKNLEKIRTEKAEDKDAKQLGLNVTKLLQKIGNKTIIDYTFAPKDALKTIEHFISGIFLPQDYYTAIPNGQIQQNRKNLEALFARLGYVVNFSENGTLWANFSLIKQLYISAFNVIESASNAITNREQFSKVYNNKQSLNQFLEDVNRNLKESAKGVENISSSTPADKNAVTILKLLLKLYGQILEKIKQDFDYKVLIKRELDSVKSKKYEFNNANNKSLTNIEQYIGAFGQTQDSNFKTNLYKNSFLKEGLQKAGAQMGSFIKIAASIENKPTDDKLEEFKTFDSNIKGPLKFAGDLIKEVSNVKEVQTVMKDLLEAYRVIVDKFEDKMKDELKITAFERFKEFLPGGKKEPSQAENLAKQNAAYKESIERQLKAISIVDKLLDEKRLEKLQKELSKVVATEFGKQKTHEEQKAYGEYKKALDEIVRLMIDQFGQISIYKRKRQEKTMGQKIDFVEELIKETNKQLKMAEDQVRTISQSGGVKTGLKDIIKKHKELRNEFVDQMETELGITFAARAKEKLTPKKLLEVDYEQSGEE